ncbi:MAG: winged helix-turn-helix domain-containing protein [Candidatus Jordarchaeaceae archaeon]
MEKKNYREMSEEELNEWKNKIYEYGWKGDPTEAHRRALHALQNPIRREILELLREKALTLEELVDCLNLDEKTLRFHLQFLKDTFFITLEKNVVDLTPLGVAYTRHAMK